MHRRRGLLLPSSSAEGLCHFTPQKNPFHVVYTHALHKASRNEDGQWHAPAQRKAGRLGHRLPPTTRDRYLHWLNSGRVGTSLEYPAGSGARMSWPSQRDRASLKVPQKGQLKKASDPLCWQGEGMGRVGRVGEQNAQGEDDRAASKGANAALTMAERLMEGCGQRGPFMLTPHE